MKQIEVDPEVVELINRSGQDFRVCTDCSGPVLLPIEYKSPKSSDIKILVGKNVLYISRLQARYINRVTMDMLYDPSRMINCSTYDDL